MKSKIARSFALGAASMLLLMPLAATAQQNQNNTATVSVSGLGKAAIAPDMAIMNFNVVKQGKSASEALSDNSKALNEVLTSLKDAGILERDLQTSNFSIQPVYRHFEPTDGVYPAPEITGYQVTNGLTVRVRDLANLGAIIDSSVKLGINQGSDITFTNDKPAEAITQARKAAVADAIAKAQTLTAAANVKLGNVIQINENQGEPSARPMAMEMMVKSSMASADSTPIAAGENVYNVTVNVTFAIEQ